MVRSGSFRTPLLILCALVCFCVLTFWHGTARAAADNFLSFGVAGGWVTAHDAKLESNPALGEVQFGPGYSVKAALGFLMARTFQLEAEYLHTSIAAGSIINPPIVTSLVASNRLTHSLMLNVTYRVETPPLGDVNWLRRGYYFYFGGGAGIAWQDYSLETVASETDSSLAWQVVLGFEKMNSSGSITSHPSPFLQYRFLHITEGDFGAFQADASLHLIEFGFRFYGGIGG